MEWLTSRKMPLFSTIRGQTHQTRSEVNDSAVAARSVHGASVSHTRNGKDSVRTYRSCLEKLRIGPPGNAKTPSAAGRRQCRPLKSRLTFREFLGIDPLFRNLDHPDRPICGQDFLPFRPQRLQFVGYIYIGYVLLRGVTRTESARATRFSKKPLHFWRS